MWFVRALSMEAMGFQAPSLRQKHQAWVVDHVSFWDPREPPGEGRVRQATPSKRSRPWASLASGWISPRGEQGEGFARRGG